MLWTAGKTHIFVSWKLLYERLPLQPFNAEPLTIEFSPAPSF